MGNLRNEDKILVTIPEVKLSLRANRRKRENNIKMDLKEIEYKCVNLIHLA
jgi:hypothetical protein